MDLKDIFQKIRSNRSYWEMILLAAVSLIVLLFIYLPSKGKANRFAVDLKNLQTNLDHAKSIIGEGKSLEEGSKILQAKLVDFGAKFPDKEYDGLNRISEMARMSGLQVVSVNSQPKSPIEDAEAKGMRIDGKACQELVVSMDLRGTYGNFVAFLSALGDSANTFTTIDTYKIHKENVDSKMLSIGLELKLYLLL